MCSTSLYFYFLVICIYVHCSRSRTLDSFSFDFSLQLPLGPETQLHGGLLTGRFPGLLTGRLTGAEVVAHEPVSPIPPTGSATGEERADGQWEVLGKAGRGCDALCYVPPLGAKTKTHRDHVASKSTPEGYVLPLGAKTKHIVIDFLLKPPPKSSHECVNVQHPCMYMLIVCVYVYLLSVRTLALGAELPICMGHHPEQPHSARKK